MGLGSTTHYEILQVSPSACVEVINAAYRALQKQMHPDVGGTNELSQAINRAHSVLSDPVQRSRYDIEIQLKPGSKERTTAKSHSDRCYVVCLVCRTRNQVEYAAIDRSTCFKCGLVFGEQGKAQASQSTTPPIPATPSNPPPDARPAWDPSSVVYAVSDKMGLLAVAFAILIFPIYVANFPGHVSDPGGFLAVCIACLVAGAVCAVGILICAFILSVILRPFSRWL